MSLGKIGQRVLAILAIWPLSVLPVVEGINPAAYAADSVKTTYGNTSKNTTGSASASAATDAAAANQVTEVRGANVEDAAEAATDNASAASSSSQKSASTSKFQGDRIQTSNWLSLLSMVAVAFIATSLIRSCTVGWNTEVIIFAAGAVAFLAGEVISLIKHEDITNRTIEYNNRSALTDAQYEALVELKESYENVKSTAKIQQILQYGAAAAFAIAAGVALVRGWQTRTHGKSCQKAVKAAAKKAEALSTKYPACHQAAVMMTDHKSVQTNTLGTPVIKDLTDSLGQVAVKKDIKNEGAGQEFYDEKGDKTAALNQGVLICGDTAFENIEKRKDVPGQSSEVVEKVNNNVRISRQCITAVVDLCAPIGGLLTPCYSYLGISERDGITCKMDKDYKTKYVNPSAWTPQKILPIINRLLAYRGIDGIKQGRLYASLENLMMAQGEGAALAARENTLAQVWAAVGAKRFTSDGVNHLGQSTLAWSSVGEGEAGYWRFVELNRLERGDTHSITLKEYDRWQKIVSYAPEMQHIYAWAMRDGIDLLVPSAQADDSITKILGLIGSVGAGVFLGIVATNWDKMNRFLAYPQNRSILFGAVAGLALGSALITGNIIKTADKNANKIQHIIDNMKQFADGAAYSINSKISTSFRFSLNSFTGMSLGESNRIPCIINGKVINKCGSAKDAYHAAENSAEDDLGITVDPALNGAAQNIITGADGLQGQNYLSAGALSSYASGGSQLAAAQKILQAKRDDLNRQLAENGEEKIDFAQAEKDLTDGLEKSTLAVINNSSGSNLDALKAQVNEPAAPVKEIKREEEKTEELPSGSANEGLDASLYTMLSGDTTPEANQEEGITAGSSNSGDIRYNYKDNDINQDQRSSIWQSISTRYLRYFPVFGEKREVVKQDKTEAKQDHQKSQGRKNDNSNKTKNKNNPSKSNNKSKVKNNKAA